MNTAYEPDLGPLGTVKFVHFTPDSISDWFPHEPSCLVVGNSKLAGPSSIDDSVHGELAQSSAGTEEPTSGSGRNAEAVHPAFPRNYNRRLAEEVPASLSPPL